MKYMTSPRDPGPLLPNIASLIERNVVAFGNHDVIRERTGERYFGLSWEDLFQRMQWIMQGLRKYGFRRGDKIVIISPNRMEMLLLELAVMASGGVAVPIFAFFHDETVGLLIRHSDARFLAVAGELQLSRLEKNLPVEKIFVFDPDVSACFDNQVPFSALLQPVHETTELWEYKADSDEICLNMYTSGTMGTPKCVQLSHRNILSQQAALSTIWSLGKQDRFLSYLPWHHSFGGIFELFTALYNGCPISLESGYGRDPNIIMENWKLVRPTVFFSVPKVYQSLVDLTRRNLEMEELLFHNELRFIFTAAAALPAGLTQEFERRKIPVIEGWGLTETAPCCTLTDPGKKREPGVVGQPIPGVRIRLADDGEVQVQGPNVMKEYYKNDEANANIFTDDGWFCTGDVGEFTKDGLRLISRKDRIFKLSNGEKVVPTDLERLIELKCHYISFAMVVGSGQEYPVAILFPNKKQLTHSDYKMSPDEGCFCPRSLEELSKCLHGCLHDANCGIGQKFAQIRAAMIIDDELSIEKGTLTPSLKVAPRSVANYYKAHLTNLYGGDELVQEEIYIIRLNDLPALTGRIFNP